MSLGGREHQHVLDPESRGRFEALALPHLGHLYRLAVRLKTPRTSSRRPT
jgi:hypothetical protein